MLGDLFKGSKNLRNSNSGNLECLMANSCFMATNCVQDPYSCTFLKSLSEGDLGRGYSPKSDYGSGILEESIGTGDYSSSVIDYLNLGKNNSTLGDYSESSSRSSYGSMKSIGDNLKYGNEEADKYTDLSQAA